MDASPDIDRGWAYAVLVGYFFTRFLILGITWSPSMLYKDLLDYFERSPSLTASATSLNTFFTYVSASISSAFIKIYGSRITMTLGCFFSTVGLLVTSFSPSLAYVFIFYGIMTGFGFSLINVSSYPVVTSYFSEYRVVVLLLASSGAGVGQFVLPLFFFWLSQIYSWRGALIIFTGLILNVLVVAAAFMPPRMGYEETMIQTTQSTEPRISSSERYSIVRSAVMSFKTILIDDLFLFRDFCFILVFLSYFLFFMGYNGILTLIKTYGLRIGLTKFESTTLMSYVGSFSLIGTGAITLFTRVSRFNVLVLNVLFLIGTGVTTIFLRIVETKTSTFIMAAVFGFFSGSLDVLPVVVLTVVGVDDIAAGIGYISVSVGIGSFAGGPIGALLLTADPTYTVSFVSLGIVCLFGASLQIPIIFLKKHG